MVCGAALNYKWKQKGLSSAFLPEHDSDSLAWAGRGHITGGDAHMYKLNLRPTRSIFDNRPVPGPNFANTGSYLVLSLHHTPWVKKLPNHCSVALCVMQVFPSKTNVQAEWVNVDAFYISVGLVSALWEFSANQCCRRNRRYRSWP